MPDLFGSDTAESAASLHPELTIAEVYLRRRTPPGDPVPGRSSRSALIVPLGFILLVIAVAYIVASLLD